VTDQHNKIQPTLQPLQRKGLLNQASILHPFSPLKPWGVLLVAIAWLVVTGCGTTTKRDATEQLLMSDAVDHAISKIDFQYIANHKVYLDTSFIKPVKSQGFVNSLYVISSIRQQLAAAGCKIQESRADADTIVEPRIATLGADGHEVTFGVPKTGGIAAAASAIAGNPITTLPEVSLAQTKAQSGVAKLYVFAYERESKEPLWQSGVAEAESNCSSTWVLGAGPIQRGSIYAQTRFAGRKLNAASKRNALRSGINDQSNSVESHAYDDHAHVIYTAPQVFAGSKNLDAKAYSVDASQLLPLEKTDATLR